MKIGVVLRFDNMEAFKEDVVKFPKIGFDNCQLISTVPELWTDENVEIVSRLLKENNVTPTAFWCGWSGPQVWNFEEGPLTLGLLPVTYRDRRIKELCAGADFAKKLGITDVITHMGFNPENPNDPELLPLCIAIREVAEHLKKNDQWLLFETGQETPVAMRRAFKLIGTDNLGVNFDTANLILYGKANPVDALEVIGKYVRNMHGKDAVYDENSPNLAGNEVAIGEGIADFKRIFTKLKALGYDNVVTIEREITGEQQVSDIKNGKEYLTKVITEVYGSVE